MTSRYTLAMGAATALSAFLFVGPAMEFLPTAAGAAPLAKPHISFSEDVLPLVKFKCGACHLAGGEGAEKSGFEVSSYESVMKGTKFGAMIIAGDPDASSLMRLLDWGVSPDIRMPHGKKQLSTCDRDLIRTWIFEGAKNN
jgi:Planctomycete cytochrome C